jgi:hypothetical protein
MPSGWFYNDVSGVVRFDQGAAYAADTLAELLGTGWHGPYKTQALADAHTGVKGASALPNKTDPLTAANNALKNAAQNAVPGAAGVADVGDFFHRLTEKETWTRVGEVILGGILVYAGVRALTHGSTVAGSTARSSATKPVRKVAKAAVTVAAPEARLATRTVAKKAAPKTTARVAAHRATVRQYGAKTPYKPPPPKQPTVRISHIHHHKAPAKKGPAKAK